MKYIASILACGILVTGHAMANPNEAPDFVPLVEARLGDGYRIVDVTVGHEDLRRDGLDATYYAEFEVALALPAALFHEVGRGDGYVLLGTVLERGETIPAYGNAVGAYQEGRWLVEVNILDLRVPGGKPFRDFGGWGGLALVTGTEQVARFQAEREAALEEAEALRMQDVRIRDAELRLEEKLRLERQVLSAQREAEARAAQELAEIEAERKVAEARSAMIAEEEAKLKASDEAIFPLLAEGSEHAVQVTHAGQRVAGTVRMTESGGSHASGTMSLALGNGNRHEAWISITGADGPGQVVARYPALDGFRVRSNLTWDCGIVGAFSAEHGILSMEPDPEDRQHLRHCGTDRIVISLGGDG